MLLRCVVVFDWSGYESDALAGVQDVRSGVTRMFVHIRELDVDWGYWRFSNLNKLFSKGSQCFSSSDGYQDVIFYSYAKLAWKIDCRFYSHDHSWL